MATSKVKDDMQLAEAISTLPDALAALNARIAVISKQTHSGAAPIHPGEPVLLNAYNPSYASANICCDYDVEEPGYKRVKVEGRDIFVPPSWIPDWQNTNVPSVWHCDLHHVKKGQSNIIHLEPGEVDLFLKTSRLGPEEMAKCEAVSKRNEELERINRANDEREGNLKLQLTQAQAKNKYLEMVAENTQLEHADKINKLEQCLHDKIEKLKATHKAEQDALQEDILNLTGQLAQARNQAGERAIANTPPPLMVGGKLLAGFSVVKK